MTLIRLSGQKWSSASDAAVMASFPSSWGTSVAINTLVSRIVLIAALPRVRPDLFDQVVGGIDKVMMFRKVLWFQ